MPQAPVRIATPLDSLPAAQRRDLMAAAPNFRDAGGLATVDGQDLRAGILYRTGQLSRLSPDAQTSLTTLGITRVFDLRTDWERASKPDRIPEVIPLVQCDVLADLPGSGASAVATLFETHGGSFSVSAVEAFIGDGRAKDHMVETYRDFLRLDSANSAYGRFVEGVADSEGAVAFHCTAGKDRAGWAAAILQMFAGVSAESVMADYLQSTARIEAVYGTMIELYGEAGGDTEALRCLTDVQVDYLDVAIDLMTDLHGDIEGYVAHGLGLGPTQRDALRTRLLAADDVLPSIEFERPVP